MSKVKRTILIATILIQILATNCFAEDSLPGIASQVKSPDGIARWFSQDFRYQFSIPNIPQTPEEMLKSKGGDCDDFAALASAVLEHMGIPSRVVAIEFKDPNDGHAVCIWMDPDGTYSFISNQQIFHTDKTDMYEAVKTAFPRATKIVTDFDRRAQSKYYRM